MKKYSMLPVLAALLLTGCATTFHPMNLNKVDPGMSRMKAQQILGEPNQVTMKAGTEELHYFFTRSSSPFRPSDQPALIRESRGQSSHYVVEIQNGSVAGISKIEK